MKNMFRRFLAALLAVVLMASVPAYAALAEESPDAGTTDSIQDNGSPDSTESTSATVAANDVESPTVNSVEDAQDVYDGDAAACSDSQTDADEPCADGANGETPAEPETSAPAPLIKVGGVLITDTADDSGWDGESGWRYDTRSISLINKNDTPLEIHAEDTGLDLSVAGYNHVSTLYADGDVNITGSGILLVDSIDMLEGANINLLTNTDIYEDGTGSVALFVLNPEDNRYYLVNGSVTGILDESVTIPAGIDLVIPASGKLEVHVVDRVYTEFDDPIFFNPDFKEYVFDHYGVSEDDLSDKSKLVDPSAPKLTIKEGGSLTIAEGAELKLDATDDTKASWDVLDGLKNVAKVIVEGILNLFGKLDGVRGTEYTPEVEVKDDGSINGTGVLENIDIIYDTAQTGDTINVEGDTHIVIKGDGPAINAGSGSTTIIFEDGATLNGIEITASDASVEFLTTRLNDAIHIKGTDADTLSAVTAPVDSVFKDGSLVGYDAEAAKALVADRNGKTSWTIPVTVETLDEDFYNRLVTKTEYTTAYSAVVSTFNLSLSAGTVSFESLSNKLLSSASGNNIVFRAVLLQDGKVVPVYLNDENGLECNAKDILALSVVSIDSTYHTVPHGGVNSGSVSFSGGNTGAGILGGAGAGTFQGGSPTIVISGSRSNQPAASDTPQVPGGNTGPDVPQNPGENVNPDTPPAPGENTNPDSPSGSDTPKAPGSGKDTIPAPAADKSLDYSVHENASGFLLEISRNGSPVQDLQGKAVAVSMPYTLPEGFNSESLFAVFVGENNAITAFRALYDTNTGTLSFTTTELGTFRVISLDWDGNDLSSPAFTLAVRAALNRG